MPFDHQQLIDQCLSVISEDDAHRRVAEWVKEAVSEPQQVIDALGEPRLAGVDRLYVSDELTVLNVVWAPLMTLLPHNHNMWAVIGVYCGREDNIFWRRTEEGEGERIEAAGARSIGVGEVQALGPNAIHSVTNPTSIMTAAIHIYGGNFFEQERSEWEPVTMMERPYDIDKNVQLFENENAVLEFRRRQME